MQAIVNAGADLLSVLFFDLKNYLPFFYEEKDHLTLVQAVLLIQAVW